MTIKKLQYLFVLTFLLMALLGMAGCSHETPTGETPPTAETEAATQIAEETEPSPSPTPSPQQPVVMLAYGENADPWTVDRLQAILEELAAESSLGLVTQEGLSEASLPPEVQVLVGIGLGVDPGGLVGANPEVSFAFVDQAGVAPGGNLSVIGDPTIDQQHQSFMSGYLAALVSSDYKLAGLIPAEQPLTAVMTDAFVIGAEFFCGVCNPLYPPYQNFPQWELLSIETAENGFQAAVDTLILNGVEVLYVQGQLASPEMLTYLSDNSVKVVGDTAPDTIRNNWVGTVTPDPGPPLIDLWPDLLAGVGGVQHPSAITLRDTGAGLISEGRLRLFEEMADKLEAGLVSPEAAP
jgi:hypothetical protein